MAGNPVPVRPRAPVSGLGAVAAGLAPALPLALLLWMLSQELAWLPLLFLPGLGAGYLRGRDGAACGLAAGVLALGLALLGLLLLREEGEPLFWLEYLADWGYHGAGIVFGNTVAGVVGTLLREERGA